MVPGEVFAKPIAAKATLTGLAAGTTTYWRALATTKSGRKARTRVRSLTFPADGDDVAFAFGSCSHLYPVSRSYTEAQALQPRFFAHLGDFGYAQDVEGAAMAARPDSYQDRWTRMLDRLSVAQLHERTSWLGLQDDHDYGADNSTAATIKPFTIDAWRQISANDDSGKGYFDARFGDVHGFFVDVHRYSDEQEIADGPGHSMLGSEQKQWLKDAMRASDAPLLVLFTPMAFWGPGLGKTSWKGAFPTEGNELLDFFFDRQGPNRRVIVCAGNAHAHYIARHPHPAGGKDVVEFVSSGTDRIRIAPPAGFRDDDVIDPQRGAKGADGFGVVSLYGAAGSRKVTLRAVASQPDDLGRTDVWPSLDVDL